MRVEWIVIASVVLALFLVWGCSGPGQRDFEAADKAMSKGEYGQAVELLTRAVQSVETSGESTGELSGEMLRLCFNRRAWANLALGRNREAEADAGRALEYSLKSPDTYVVRGLARGALGRLAEAESDMDAALGIQPGYAPALSHRGYVRLERGHARAALEDLGAALEAGTLDARSRARSLVLRGTAHERLGDHEAALEDWSVAARGGDADMAAWAHGARGDLLMRLERPAEAEGDYSRLVELRPESSRAYAMRGRSRYARQRNALALEDWTRAVELAPDDAGAHNRLAWALATMPGEGLRDAGRALSHAKRAVELSNYREAAYVDTLAAALAEAGRFGQAVEVQVRAVALLRQTGPRDLVPEFEMRLDLYRRGRPYREFQTLPAPVGARSGAGARSGGGRENQQGAPGVRVLQPVAMSGYHEI